MPGPVGEVPPMPTKIFLLASMSFELRCQCPMVTPASLGVKGCADTVPVATVVVRNNATSRDFMNASLRACDFPPVAGLTLTPDAGARKPEDEARSRRRGHCRSVRIVETSMG